MHAKAEKELFLRAKELRENCTKAEEILWYYLGTKPLGHKFRRQHPYSIYILDFYCHRLKLVIEVDGSIHNLKEVQENDQIRQQHLEQNGLHVTRFTNEEVLANLETVIQTIEQLIKEKTNPKNKE